MDFVKIQNLELTCGNCFTKITTPLDSTYRSQQEQLSNMICPCCGRDLSSVASSAYHKAYEYNKACDAVISFQDTDCKFC